MSWIKIKTWLKNDSIVVCLMVGLLTGLIVTSPFIDDSYLEKPSTVTIYVDLLFFLVWLFLVIPIAVKWLSARIKKANIAAKTKDLNDTAKQRKGLLADNIGNKVTDELAKDIEKNIYNRLAHSKLSRQENREQAEEQFNVISRRVEDIESRLPGKDSIDKIASINDALFAERIDQLSKKIEKIEGKTLTKWDVAIICALMFGGVFAILRFAPDIQTLV